MYLVHFITLILLAAIIYKYTEAFDSEIANITSSVDKRNYIVLNLPDKGLAADQLARLRDKIDKFLTILPKTKTGFIRLKKKYKAVLSENRPGSSYTSYTVNKGSKIYMCIRERDDGGRLINDENTLFFVALHELSHIMTISVGHTPEFWNNFKTLLKIAIDHGYYIYQPYHELPQRYCGTIISNTPYKL